jgi:DNA-binding transcriptional LysR family regulator
MVLLDLPHSREYFETVAARSGRPPRVAYRSSSYETVRCLVAQGFGYTILNQRPVSDVTYDGGRIACLGLLDDLDPLPVVLAAASAVRPTPRAAAFAAVCRTLVPELHGSGPDGRTPTPHR